MAFFTVQEIIDLIVMVLAIGFIFSRIFPRKPSRLKHYDPLDHYSKSRKDNIIEDIKYGALIAAPAVVLHEISHKFVAMYFGASATLHAPYFMYAIVILMILLRSPIIFFVGGFVSHTGLPALQSAIVSVSGPLTNLVLWGVFAFLSTKDFGKKNIETLSMMKKINMFLFIFNMVPLPGFDGFNFFSALFRLFTG